MARFLGNGRSRKRVILFAGLVLSAFAGAGLATAFAGGGPTAGLSEFHMTGLPPAKQAILDKALSVPAGAPVQTDLSLHPAPDTTVLPPRTPGFFEGGEAGPFPAGSFVIRNGWHGPFAGVWYIVYAGGYPDDQGDITQGGLRIYSLPEDPNAVDQNLSFVGDYPATTVDALTIASVHGSTVSLQGDSGAQVTFDLASKQYR